MKNLTTSEVYSLVTPVADSLKEQRESYLFLASCRDRGSLPADAFVLTGSKNFGRDISELIADAMHKDQLVLSVILRAVDIYIRETEL